MVSDFLTKSEQNYPINELEKLVVIEGYQDNVFVAYGHLTIIFCDNEPSEAYAKQLETRMLRNMQSLVNDTGAKVSYSKGDDHQGADFLSQFTALIVEEIAEDISTYYTKENKKRQKEDKAIFHIKQCLQEGKTIHIEIFGEITLKHPRSICIDHSSDALEWKEDVERLLLSCLEK